jgi:putative phosphoribosyl transferase
MIEVMFRDRGAAGRFLGRRLAHLRGAGAVVLGLPRGGVPVAFEAARALGLPLDVIVVRKVGVPGDPELAMGAVPVAAGDAADAVAEMADEMVCLVRPASFAAVGRYYVDFAPTTDVEVAALLARSRREATSSSSAPSATATPAATASRPVA